MLTFQTSTPKHIKDENKIEKIKYPGKRAKANSHHNDRHNFNMDFIHSDDIIHHSNGNIYIKKKCKYCTFKTPWESEMARHEYKIHSIGPNPMLAHAASKKAPRPIPNLIPIQHSTTTSSQASTSYQNINETDEKVTDIINLSEIKELSAKAGFSSLNDFISLFGEDELEPKNTNDNNHSLSTEPSTINSSSPENKSSSLQDTLDASSLELKRKHTSFFDKLKAKLMTNAGESCNLTCKWCGHESKCLSELAGHQKTCGKEQNNSTLPSKIFNVSSTRCQYCRQRCKSSVDLLNHLQVCPTINQSPKDLSVDIKSDCSETTKDETSLDASQDPHPMENVVFVWNSITKPDDKQEMIEKTSLAEEIAINEQQPPLALPIQHVETSLEVAPVINSTNKMPTHGTDIDQVSEGKRVFKCPHCTFWASTASRFHVHIVGHLNKKPFECSLCSYRSNWRWDITKHIRLKSVRDSAHSKAKVLMTDETGRRNYSKYNKYLTQMKGSKSDAEKENKEKNNNAITQGHVISDNELSELPKLIPATVSSSLKPKIQTNQLRPPPPLKPAYPSMYADNAHESKKKNDADTKKTLFKCKKCNFR